MPLKRGAGRKTAPSNVAAAIRMARQAKAAGGEVAAETDPDATASFDDRFNALHTESSPFEVAATRMRQANHPMLGRQEDPESILSPTSLLREGAMAFGPGLAGRAVTGAIEYAPRAAAGLAGLAGGLFASDATGGSGDPEFLTKRPPGMKPSEWNRMRHEYLVGQSANNQKQATLEAQSRAEVEAERQKALTQAELEDRRARDEVQRRREDVAFQANEEMRHSALPFRDKYPGIANMLPLYSAGLATFLPYSGRVADRMASNAAVSKMEGAVGAGERLLADPVGRSSRSAMASRVGRNAAAQAELQSGADTAERTPAYYPSSQVKAGALLAADTPMIPMEYDATMLAPDNPNRQAALDTLKSPPEWLARAAPAGLGGLAAAKGLGANMPVPWPARVAPIDKMRGTAAGLGELNKVLQEPRAAPAPKFAPMPAAKPKRSKAKPADDDAAPAMAGGGMVPWYVRSEARGMGGMGGLHSPIAGRTDHIPLNVKPGSYVLPADIVSGLGEGNSQNGMKILNHMFFNSGPYGLPTTRDAHGAGLPKAPPAPKFAFGGYADGGDAGNGNDVPIMAAGGEFVISPEKAVEIGHGDIDLGHDILDEFVKHVREKTIKELSKLPGPQKD